MSDVEEMTKLLSLITEEKKDLIIQEISRLLSEQVSASFFQDSAV